MCLKNSLDSSEANEKCIMKSPHEPNMQDLLDQFFAEITTDANELLQLSEVNVNYTYKHLQQPEETGEQSILQMGEN